MWSKRLREMRHSAGLTQKGVGERLGMTHNAVSLYERDKRNPDPKSLVKLAQLYATTSDYLLGLSDDPRTVPQMFADAVQEDVKLREFWERFKLKGDLMILVESVRDLDPVTLRKIVRAVQGFLEGENSGGN